MLDSFLKVAYEVETRKKAEYDMVGLLKDIPTLELRKLASGTPIAELYAKEAMLGDCAPKSDCDGPQTFLDKFKDTPYFEEAMSLEQEMLEAEAADIAKRVQENAGPRPWEIMDQIRLKKRLLELKLAKDQAGGGAVEGAAPPGAPPDEVAQGAGAPGPVPAEGVQDSAQGLGGGVAKTGSALVKKSAAEMVQFSEGFARALARSDFEKAARVETLTKVGSVAGSVMAKSAGLGGSLMGAIKPLAGKAMGLAAAHPSAAGALAGGAVGAAGGAIAGGPDHRLGGALGGAALGAGVGHAAGGIGARMGAAGGGMGLGEAAKSYGAGVQRQAGAMLGPSKPAAPPLAGSMSTGVGNGIPLDGHLGPGNATDAGRKALPGGAVQLKPPGVLATAPAGGGVSVGAATPKALGA